VDIRQKVFEVRGYTPIPFVVLMLVYARPTPLRSLPDSVLRWRGRRSVSGALQLREPKRARRALLEERIYLLTGHSPMFAILSMSAILMMYVGVGIMSNAFDLPYLVVLAYGFFLLQYTDDRHKRRRVFAARVRR